MKPTLTDKLKQVQRHWQRQADTACMHQDELIAHLDTVAHLKAKFGKKR